MMADLCLFNIVCADSSEEWIWKSMFQVRLTITTRTTCTVKPYTLAVYVWDVLNHQSEDEIPIFEACLRP